MATPITANRLAAALRAEGVRVVERSGWKTHNRNHKGPWGPVNGVMIHHTVTSGTSNTVGIVERGYEGLPGPLCHGMIAKDGTVHLIGQGRTNHAGRGDGDVLRAVIAERALPAANEADTDGNTHFYGFECENLGDGHDPWPPTQLDAIERAATALCRAHGWSAASVIGHKEWQPGKVDPKGFTMAWLRERVAGRLKSKPSGGSSGGGSQGASGSTYVVKGGETLSGIGKKLGVSWERLAQVNKITAPYVITPGQKLTVPGKAAGGTYTPPPFPNGLAPGRSSPSAKSLQMALKDTGWLDRSVPLADNYGPQTQKAVTGFNRKHNLFTTGRPNDPAIGRRGWDLLHQLAYGN
ncbi:N-acetylmuramoyl-L-alanine amidase [Streptomyces sp. NBC_01381]|uniref:N-acetylmuramoyl-L-alanine amidase n=1 Tax=Streptomyces sp. NBC_01381 TaxID=2903845 RepID=UPI00225025AF|nr:N-acetylmuramoyl-L-alanine amidase [Streptomyces sp. NBC_01381]MCX4666439.1 N-acetylmuramoyl-L-alanine amidase [Streptomyces sp. NBC_01381]